MESICIVTDNSAQFSSPNQIDPKFVTIVPLRVQINGQIIESNEQFKAGRLPKSASTGNIKSYLLPPTYEYLRDIFLSLGKAYDTIFAIFLSSALNPCFKIASEIAASLLGNINVVVIDSKTTSIGLGFLVQKVAEEIRNGKTSQEIDLIIRTNIPLIYSVLCIPGLSYLYHNGFIDLGQAIIGEMLGIYPLYAIEDGMISPFDKARNQRNTADYFIEFAEEFIDVSDIALLQSSPPNPSFGRIVREQITNIHPSLSLSEIPINLSLATLFGPRTTGLFLVERDSSF